MRIGLLGGTFDPIHKGHLKLARAAQRQYHLSSVYMILAPRSPFKTASSLTPMADRLRMLKLALRGQSSLKLGRWELQNSGPSYTVRTLEKIVGVKPHDEFFLIMGSDAWASFSHWKNPKKILRLAKILVGRRPGGKPITVPPGHKNHVRLLKGLFPDISSTSIRAGQRVKIVSTMVPPAVRRYIQKHGLYATIG